MGGNRIQEHPKKGRIEIWNGGETKEAKRSCSKNLKWIHAMSYGSKELQCEWITEIETGKRESLEWYWLKDDDAQQVQTTKKMFPDLDIDFSPKQKQPAKLTCRAYIWNIKFAERVQEERGNTSTKTRMREWIIYKIIFKSLWYTNSIISYSKATTNIKKCKQ